MSHSNTQIWRVQLLGGLSVSSGDTAIHKFQGRKSGAVFAYLAFYLGHNPCRDDIVEAIWPERDFLDARKNLSQMLHLICDQFGNPPDWDQMLIANKSHVWLNPDRFTTDVIDFQGQLKAAERASYEADHLKQLISAVDLYTGQLLPGHTEEWIEHQRQRLNLTFVNALRRLLGELEDRGERSRALECAMRAVASVPECEEAHYDLIRLHIAAGRNVDAVKQYRTLMRTLRKSFDCDPSDETRALVEPLLPDASIEEPDLRIKRSTSSSPMPVPPRRPAPPLPPVQEEPREAAHLRPPARLPAPLTRFFGREEEISQLMDLILPQAAEELPEGAGPRLISLLGPGGSGKSRLAVQVARKLINAFRGEVHFVPLATATHEDEVIDATLGALCISRQPAQNVFQLLAGRLSDRPTLLVLDNLEQVQDISGFVAALLEWAPRTVLLATSRLALRIPGENEFPVRPLPVPVLSASPERLMDFACVRMFVDRAQAVRPDFHITETNAEAVASICERLEGLPLAIELAAARAKLLTPEQMLEQLNKRFDFLESRQQGVDTRHQTLRAAFDWSYDLLPELLGRFLGILSVFRGTYSLPAVRFVADQKDSLASLEQLADHSLLFTEDAGEEVRYGMLESLREYAAERIKPHLRERCRQRHAEFFIKLAEDTQRLLRGQAADEWVTKLDRDHGNLMEALNHTLSGPGGIRMAGALWRYWYLRGFIRDGKERLEKALEAGTAAPQKERARAALGLGVLTHHMGDLPAAGKMLRQALSLANGAGDAFLTAEVHHNMAILLIAQGEYDAGRDLCERALAYRYVLQDTWGAAAELNTLGSLEHSKGNLERAAEYMKESQRNFEEIGDDTQCSLVLLNLGVIASDREDLAGARAAFELSLTLLRDQRNRWAAAVALNNLGGVLTKQGELERAGNLLRQSLAELLDLGDTATATSPVDGLAEVAFREGDFARSARLSAAYAAMNESSGRSPDALSVRNFERRIEKLKDRLTGDDFEAAWRYGQSLSWKRLAAYCLEPEPSPMDESALVSVSSLLNQAE